MITFLSTGVNQHSEVFRARLDKFSLHVAVEQIKGAPEVPTAHELVHPAEIVGRSK